MKTKQEVKALHVLSEPGDATRYDYFVIRIGDHFYFSPCDNDFNYPKYISVWDTDDTNIEWLASKFECNPHTVAECQRTMIEIIGEEDDNN